MEYNLKDERINNLAVFAIQQIAHGFPAGGIPLAVGLAAGGFFLRLICQGRLVGGAAFRTTVGKAGFIRLQLKLFSTNRASFDWKSHAQ